MGNNAAVEAGLTRRDVDEWAAYTHGQAIQSIDNGWFDEQIVPVTAPQMDGSTIEFFVDEHPRRGVTVDTLAELAPLHPEIEGFTVTAGNAAGINDAAAAVVVTADDYAAANGLTPLARIVSWASMGIEPARTGMAPTLAIPKALERAGMSIDDIELWEINEAFCSVPVAAYRTLGHRPHHPQRERQRLQPRPPHRRHRRPHGRDDGARAASPRPHHRLRLDVRRRRHGLRAGPGSALTAARRRRVQLLGRRQGEPDQARSSGALFSCAEVRATVSPCRPR